MAQTIAIAQNTETDLARTVTPMNGAWPKWNGTRTSITDGDVDTAIAGAASGTVFVLSSVVTNTLASTAVPAGVTLRGPPADALLTTLSVTGNITVGNNCTFRDMTLDNQSTKFTFSGNAWFENVRFTKDTIADDPPSSSSHTVTFSRCTFIKTRDFAWFGAGTTSQGHYVFLDCVFIDARTTGTATPLIKIGKGDITFKNCIFDTAISGTHWVGQSAASPPGDMSFYNCVFESAPTDLTAITNVTGANNWSPTSPAVPIGATVNTRLNINTENYGHLLPTNASAFRSGGSSSYARRLDRNYLPYDASTPSAGAYQWQAESSCLVRQRTSNPLSGFSFTYGDQTTALSLWRLTVPSVRANQDIIEAHYVTAAIVRAYVHDLVHPSRGDFYVTWDGYYRLVLNHGLFSLTTTGEAARFFGATTLTDTGDTGALSRDNAVYVIPLLYEESPGVFISAPDVIGGDTGYTTGVPLPANATRRVLHFEGISNDEEIYPTISEEKIRRIINYFYGGGVVRVYRFYPGVLSPWDVNTPGGYDDVITADHGSAAYEWFSVNTFRRYSFVLDGISCTE